MTNKEYHQEFDNQYKDHKPNLYLNIAEEKGYEKYPVIKADFGFTVPDIIDLNKENRDIYIEGFKDGIEEILSKIDQDHIDGLKWVKRSGITTQPIPFHKYCDKLLKILERIKNG